MSGKRGAGEGSINKRAKGGWQGQLTLPSGKRQSVYGKTRREVQEKLAGLRREVEAGLHDSAASRQTLAAYAAQWMAHKRHTLRSKTVLGYDALLAHHLGDLGDLSLTKITPARLQAHYAAELTTHSPTTVHHVHALIHAILESAVRLGILPRNVADQVDAPPLKPDEIHPLTFTQAQTLIQAWRGHRFAVGYLLALSLGLRSAEVRGVRWSDINLDLRRLRVLTTLHRVNGAYVLEETKSRASRRTLPLPPYVAESLDAHRARQDADKALMGAAWQNGWDLALTTEAGAPVHESVFLHEFQQICGRVGLPATTRVHDLRHTFATLLLERGVHIKVVADLLGHNSVDITLKTYGHITPRMEAGALHEINALLPDVGLPYRLPYIVDEGE